VTRGPAALHCGRRAAAETNADALREQLNSRALSAQKDGVARGAQQVTASSEAQSYGAMVAGCNQAHDGPVDGLTEPIAASRSCEAVHAEAAPHGPDQTAEMQPL